MTMMMMMHPSVSYALRMTHVESYQVYYSMCVASNCVIRLAYDTRSFVASIPHHDDDDGGDDDDDDDDGDDNDDGIWWCLRCFFWHGEGDYCFSIILIIVMISIRIIIIIIIIVMIIQ